MRSSVQTLLCSERVLNQLSALRRNALEELEELEWQLHHLENDLIRLGHDLGVPARAMAGAASDCARELSRACPLCRALTR